VPLRVATREGAVSTPEIEDLAAGTADPRAKQRRSFRLAEDEVPPPELGVVTPVDVLDLFEQGHQAGIRLQQEYHLRSRGNETCCLGGSGGSAGRRRRYPAGQAVSARARPPTAAHLPAR